MVDQMEIVRFTTPISNTATFDVTHGSITEPFSAAILIFSKETSDSTDNQHGLLGIGFIGADGTAATDTQGSVATTQSEDNVLSSQDQNTLVDNNEVVILASDGTNVTPIVIQASYVSAVTGGFRLNVTTVGAGPIRTKGVAIIFAGLSKAASGSCTFNDVASDHENVGVSPFFQPDVVIFRPIDNNLAGNNENATVALGLAARTSPIQQVCSYINWDNATDPTDGDGFLRSDACSGAFIGTTRTEMDRFIISSFDSTGFNAQAVATAGINTPQANYLALKFTDSATPIFCGNLAFSGSTGTQSFTGVGFQPRLVFGMSTLLAALDTLTDGATTGAAGLFCFNAAEQRAYTVQNQEGLNIGGAVVTNANTRQEDVAVLTYANDASIAQRATLSAMTSTGFDLSVTTATVGFLTFLAIGVSAQSLILSDTEQISDQSVLFLSQSLVVSDTVEITDSVEDPFTTDVSDTGGLQGETFAGGSERGTSFQGQAEAGTVM